MSKPIEIASAEQFNDLLKKSRVVVADCKSLSITSAPSEVPRYRHRWSALEPASDGMPSVYIDRH